MLRISPLIATIWRIFWSGVLRLLFGEGWFSLVKQMPKIAKVRAYPREHLLFGVKDLGNGFAQVRVPDGLIVQPVDEDAIKLKDKIYWREVYDRYHKIRKNDVVVDVGAFVGIFTLRMAKKANMVAAIEPHPQNFKLLARNVRSNNLTNVVPVNVALGSYDGRAKLHVSKISTAGHSITPHKSTGNKSLQVFRPDDFVEVEVRTLDSLIKDLGLERVDFIKIDVEGAELDVLRGAEKVLLDNRSRGLTVVAGAYHYARAVEEIGGFLASRKFRVSVYYDGDMPQVLGEA